VIYTYLDAFQKRFGRIRIFQLRKKKAELAGVQATEM